MIADWIINLDSALFQFINCGLANPLTDLTMPVITNHWFLRGVLAAILLLLFVRGGRTGRLAAVVTGVAVLLADQSSSSLLKPLVARVRPCHILENVNLLVPCSQGLSFPSSHAANSAAVAIVLSLIYPRAAYPLFLFALLVAYSRVAVGVHYPLDVITGAAVGSLCGLAAYQLYRFLAKRRLSAS